MKLYPQLNLITHLPQASMEVRFNLQEQSLNAPENF